MLQLEVRGERDRRCHGFHISTLFGARDLLLAQTPTTKTLFQPKGVSKLLPTPKESKEYRTKSDGIYSLQKEVINCGFLQTDRKVLWEFTGSRHFFKREKELLSNTVERVCT